MNYSVAVTLKRSPYGTFRLFPLPSSAVLGETRIWRQRFAFDFHGGFTYYVRHTFTSIQLYIRKKTHFPFFYFKIYISAYFSPVFSAKNLPFDESTISFLRLSVFSHGILKQTFTLSAKSAEITVPPFSGMRDASLP